MTLYLVHHADAVVAALDATRPLSAHGREQAADVSARVAAHGAMPRAIWHSGKLRARETAEIYWRVVNPAAPMSAARGLQPEDDPEWLADLLTEETDDLMVVSHYPLLPGLLQIIAGQSAVFPQHGAVAFEKTASGWVERWREAATT